LQPGRVLPTLVLLALSLVLSATALDWGLPADGHSWAFDEIQPYTAERGARARFAGGWAANYPPLHYMLLAVTQRGARALAGAPWDGTPWDDLSPAERDTRMRRAGRWLSVLMATLLVWGIYRCARLFAGRWEARLAALLCATCLPFVYYAKTTNVDVPYLMWMVASAWFFLRALGRHRPRDFILLGVTAAAAVATKDQAYAFYGVMPFLLAGSLWRRPDAAATAGQPRSWRTLLDRRLWAGAGAGLLAFAALENLFFNWGGFVRHLGIITGRSASRFHAYPATLAGHLAMAGKSLEHLGFAMSWPVFLAALYGVGLALRQPRLHRPQLALLACSAGYYALFVTVIRHNFVRFLLPVALVLAFFAAAAVREAWNSRLPRALTAGAVTLALLFAVGRAAAVDQSMLGDSRYAAEAWLARHAGPGSRVGGVGRPQMLPRGVDSIPWSRAHRLGPQKLRHRDFDFLVFSRSGLWEAREEALYRRLQRPGSGFALATCITGARPWLLPSTDGLYTNLDKVSPEVCVLRRLSRGAARRRRLEGVAQLGGRPPQVALLVEAAADEHHRVRAVALQVAHRLVRLHPAGGNRKRRPEGAEGGTQGGVDRLALLEGPFEAPADVDVDDAVAADRAVDLAEEDVALDPVIVVEEGAAERGVAEDRQVARARQVAGGLEAEEHWAQHDAATAQAAHVRETGRQPPRVAGQVGQVRGVAAALRVGRGHRLLAPRHALHERRRHLVGQRVVVLDQIGAAQGEGPAVGRQLRYGLAHRLDRGTHQRPPRHAAELAQPGDSERRPRQIGEDRVRPLHLHQPHAAKQGDVAEEDVEQLPELASHQVR
jgi:Dolichyl-phosphate-mannose-protein mannosyltransferase